MLRAPTRAVALAVAAALAVSACGGDAPEPTPSPSPTVAASPEVPEPSPTPTETPDPSTPRPLNGVGVPEGEEETLERRVVAVKIDNHELARPQTGIDRADAVYELVVEAGLTRFIALFHANDTVAGPMRSGRPSDPGLLKPLGATFTISGAQGWVIDIIQGAGVPLIGDIGPPLSFRSRNRPAPHNLYADTTEIRAEADRRGYPDEAPPTWFTFVPWPDDLGAPAEDLTIGFSGSTTIAWSWDGEAYARSQNGQEHGLVTSDGDTRQVTADTLLVLETGLYTAQPPGSGTAVPAVDSVGSGRAFVFSGGRVVEGTWQRESAEELFQLRDAEGQVLPLPPGFLWISLLPTGRSVTWS
ncbi:MAG: DUF3048 domain-containing protein [Actinobacteria bacterium]|nr:DUF3048 domain-containing protein [Actinomycetota bacterium]